MTVPRGAKASRGDVAGDVDFGGAEMRGELATDIL